jgi:hypothetical protein
VVFGGECDDCGGHATRLRTVGLPSKRFGVDTDMDLCGPCFKEYAAQRKKAGLQLHAAAVEF